jgi:hypothetical protein
LCSGEIDFVNVVYFVGAEEKVDVKVVEGSERYFMAGGGEGERAKFCFVGWFTDVALSFM